MKFRMPFLRFLFPKYLIGGLLIHCLLWLPCHAQIVNIEKERIKNQETKKLVGKISATLNITQNKKLAVNADLNPHLQYKYKKHLILAMAQMEYLAVEKTSINSGGFFHVRYNYALTQKIKAELFSQVQYNKIWNMPLRFLLGAGPRFKLMDIKLNRLYFGPLYLFELQKVSASNQTQYNHRLSAYLSWNVDLAKGVLCAGTVYYQPLLRDLSNYRISGLCELNIALSPHFTFDNRFGFIYDQTQTIDIPVQTYRFTSGFGYTF